MLNFSVNSETCTHCGECARDCVAQIIEMTEDGPRIAPENEARCMRCQHCLTVCKPGALSILGIDPASLPKIKGLFPSPEAMLALISGRRSVRRYKKTPVDAETLDILMDAVSQAPTGVNRRTGGFTLIDDPNVMEQIRQASRERVAGLFRDQAFPKPLEFYRGYFESFAAGNDPIFRGAPQMLIATYQSDNPSGPGDCFIALSYFELLAQSMGLGTLWCGLGRVVLSTLVPDLPARLGIPENQSVGFVMLFGKPAVKYHRAVRRERAAVNVPKSVSA